MHNSTAKSQSFDSSIDSTNNLNGSLSVEEHGEHSFTTMNSVTFNDLQNSIAATDEEYQQSFNMITNMLESSIIASESMVMNEKMSEYAKKQEEVYLSIEESIEKQAQQAQELDERTNASETELEELETELDQNRELECALGIEIERLLTTEEEERNKLTSLENCALKSSELTAQKLQEQELLREHNVKEFEDLLRQIDYKQEQFAEMRQQLRLLNEQLTQKRIDCSLQVSESLLDKESGELSRQKLLRKTYRQQQSESEALEAEINGKKDKIIEEEETIEQNKAKIYYAEVALIASIAFLLVIIAIK